MAYIREAFKPRINTTLTDVDKKHGANLYLWSIEDIVEKFGGTIRELNNKSVLRFKINLHAILDKEKKALIDEFKNNVDKEIDNKLLSVENKIRSECINQLAQANGRYRGGLYSNYNPKHLKSVEESFGINIINSFITKINEIELNTDIRFIEIDDANPYFKNNLGGGTTFTKSRAKHISKRFKKTVRKNKRK